MISIVSAYYNRKPQFYETLKSISKSEFKDFYFNPYEKCVVCKKQTNVPIDLHIDLRKNYVEGVGQLCDDCAKKIHYSNE